LLPPDPDSGLRWFDQRLSSFPERGLSQVGAPVGKEIERDQLGRCCLREHGDTRFGGVNPLLKGVEFGFTVDDHNDLTIYDRARWQLVEGWFEFGEVTE
jgi:hypothetical protein